MSETPDHPEERRLPTGESDRTLMVRAHEGDPLAALALVDRYSGPLWNLVHRTTGLAGLAADVVRETLSSAVRGLAERVPRGDRRWIVDLASDAYRRLLAADVKPEGLTHRFRISPRYWEAERLAVSSHARPSPRRAGQKLRQRLWRSYSRLSMRQRFVLALTETAQVAPAELGEVLGEPEAVARTIRDGAKLALMEHLADRPTNWTSRVLDRRRRRQP